MICLPTAAMLQAGIKVGEAQCSTDYIIITNGSQDGGFASGSAKDRYCGTALGRCVHIQRFHLSFVANV